MPTPFSPTPAAQGIVLRQGRQHSDLVINPIPEGDPRNEEGLPQVASFLVSNRAKDLVERRFYIDFEGFQRDL